ncbi:BolA family transcriptional regulator [Neisseria leonii]|uniref:BolA family protein n=1 Tax=Neisseria leonii TaxID=2995413 RepID=UPI00237BE1BC|nr:BolA family protein [Neisseria sp. 3986]MDD9326599.1 BolA family transcriptional regulator [Neisseria sp. 3986]
MQQHIAERLSALNLQHYEFSDDSHLHAGHAGNTGGGHYRILVVSEAFNGHSRLARQRMIQEPLQDFFAQGVIHALSIRALTPGEYAAR